MTKAITDINGLGITKNLIGINYTKGIFIKPKYIVVHDIIDDRFTTMREYRNYIARDKEAKESVHYLVGARAIIKLLEDDWRGWHVGDKPSKEITNSNSIGVAMFIREKKDIHRTMENVIELVNQLRELYGISIDNVKRHFDVTGKNCPQVLADEELWQKFKYALKGLKHELVPIANAKIIGVLSSLNLKDEPRDDAKVIGKISSKESFYIYEVLEEWVKTTYETEDKIIVGYLNREYLEIQPLVSSANNKVEQDESSEIKDMSENEALEELSKLYKKPKTSYNAIEELEKLSLKEEGIIEDVKVVTKVEKQILKEILPIIKKEINRDGIIVNVDTNLEVRRGPGEENFVIGYLLAAQKIKVAQEIGDWYKIVYQSTIGKRIGYVEKNFVKIR